MAVQVVLDAPGLRGIGGAHVEHGHGLAGLVDHPLARQADHLVLRDLQRAAEHGDHQHDDRDVVGENVPPWLQDAVRWLRVSKVPELCDGNHDGLSEETENRGLVGDVSGLKQNI